jgi:hypothetical protein
MKVMDGSASHAARVERRGNTCASTSARTAAWVHRAMTARTSMHRHPTCERLIYSTRSEKQVELDKKPCGVIAEGG